MGRSGSPSQDTDTANAGCGRADRAARHCISDARFCRVPLARHLCALTEASRFDKYSPDEIAAQTWSCFSMWSPGVLGLPGRGGDGAGRSPYALMLPESGASRVPP